MPIDMSRAPDPRPVRGAYDHLRKQVESQGGIYAATMGELREIHGAGRLGQHVRTAISASLRANGLGHLPAVLPAYQEHPVRVYQLGTPLADVVDAVLTPSAGGDQLLRQVGTSTSQEVIKQIRQLVCE